MPSPKRLPPDRAALDPLRLIRYIVGLFYLPHVYSKIVGFEGTVGFFAAAGFQPAQLFVVLAGVAELAIALALLSGLFVKQAALASVGLMLAAAFAQYNVKGLGWYWNAGGIEYLVFWGLASLAVFLDAWRKSPGLLSRH